MFQQTFAIARNTFFESIRQPIMLVLLLVATILIVLSNPLAAFTMEDDQRMLVDLGLATVFICGCLLAAFIATNVLGREIENRTALTVISKPVPRPLFVLGKYLGVAAALTLGTLYMTFVFLLTEQHTVLQTVRDPIHAPVMLFSLIAAVIGVGVAVWCNYFYGKVFASTVLITLTPLAALAYLFSMMFRADFSSQPISLGFKPQLWLAVTTLWVAILVLTAIALAASTRLGQVMTLVVTLGVFMLGMLSDWIFGRPLARLEQTLTLRVKALTPGEVDQTLAASHLDPLRAWTLATLEDEARRNAATGPCQAIMEIMKMRSQATGKSQSDWQQQMEGIRQTVERDVAARLNADLTEARRVIETLQWPPAGERLALEVRWPQVVDYGDEGCEVIPTRRPVVYPPALRAVRTTAERMQQLGCLAARAVLPNFQVMFLSDALTQGHRIPVKYVLNTMLYGVLYIGAAVSLATFLFQTREVG